MLNWNYLFAGIKQGLSNPHQLPAKVILIQRIGFSTKKKKKKIIMNKSSSFLVHLHLLHFLIIKKKISIFKRKILQNHIPKEKSPMNKSSIKISKTSIEKSLRINLQGKISTNKSSKGKISKTIFQRKNLHEQIFLKIFKN